MKEKRKCKNCHYCNKNPYADLSCRINPPVGFKEPSRSGYILRGHWPRVDGEKGWCGHFLCKPEEGERR